jgi:D-alanine-D-alanine ligase
MKKRLRVALVFGGRSGEHEVSVISARSVAAYLDRTRFDLVPMAIDRAGRWADTATAAALLAAPGATPDTVPTFTGSTLLDERLVAGGVDVVLPVLHGPFGEDGTIQGLCEVLDLPYVGSGVTASGVVMDKVLTKRLLREAGLLSPEFVAIAARAWAEEDAQCQARCLNLRLPLFVKPARLGSSVGITKVKSGIALRAAIEAALAFDDVVIVEEGIEAREIEVAVLGGEPPFASLPGEVVPGHEFYDYADKYLDDHCQLLAPAPLGEEQVGEARRLAVAAFTTLGCEGMARVDFLLEGSTGRFFLNELNTIPGFTSISMYPRLMALSGVPYDQLLSRLVDLALERHARRRRFAEAALLPLDKRVRGAADTPSR